MAEPVAFVAPAIPSACPVCGAFSLAPEVSVSVVLAVCDVLVVKALEKLGTFLLRQPDRSKRRDPVPNKLPRHIVHTVWPSSDELVDKALWNAWDVVPLILNTHGGCCEYNAEQVTAMLDQYVHDLAITRSEHDINELAYRMQSQLGFPIVLREDANAHG